METIQLRAKKSRLAKKEVMKELRELLEKRKQNQT